MTNKERAMAVIGQLQRGEWTFVWNPLSRSALTATRDGVEMWCGNGGWFTDFRPSVNAFGYFWRHVVYHKGVRPAKRRFEAEYKKAPPAEWWEAKQ